eukprot:scaffold253243_cov44-Prasinocladus_malaysianus.AAC.1
MCECGRVAIPRYGLPGWESKNAKWCGTCPNKPPEAVDLKCLRCECGHHNPSYELPWERVRRWCSACPTKPPHAVRSFISRCECGNSAAYYGMRGDKKPRWCLKCPNYHDDA